MKGFRFIYFDAGLTILGNNHVTLFKAALNDLGYDRSYKEVEKAYHLTNKEAMRRNLFHASDGGDEFAGIFLSFLSLPVSTEVFSDAYKKYSGSFKWSPFPFTKDVLLLLKRKGYGLGVLSNWDSSLRNILTEGGIYDLFDTVIISCEVGFEKPDVRIFEKALESSRVEGEECLFVGDNYYDDVVGAEKAGIRTILINPDLKSGIEELDYPYIISSIEELPAFLLGDMI